VRHCSPAPLSSSGKWAQNASRYMAHFLIVTVATGWLQCRLRLCHLFPFLGEGAKPWPAAQEV